MSLWYTDKDGKSISLGQEIADKDGKLSFELIAGSDLVAGESYSVVGYGNRSQVSGSCVVTVSNTPSS